MALLTIHEMLAAIRLATSITETPDPTVANIVMRMMDAAENEIEGYAPDAPQHTKEQSQIQYVGWLYDSNPAGSKQPHANGFRESGAMALLSAWRVPRAAQTA